MAAMLVAAKLFGELAERIGQPAVLGELIAGLLLGSSILGVVPSEGPATEVIHVLAELGVVLLLFEIGLETDLREMFRVGPASLAVASVGVVLPFALGFAYWAYLPHAASDGTGLTTAIFVGATLTATSVGITARVLSDLNQMNTQEARIIIGAAVIDDVLGLVILTVVSALATGASLTTLGILRIFAIAVSFLVIAVLVGRFVAPRLFDVVMRMQVRYVLLVFAVAFALALSATAALAGSALIIGAFAAGLILSGTNQFDTIEREVRPVASIFTPIFFVSVGASVNLRLLDPTREGAAALLGVAAVLTVLAILGKVAAGWAAPWVRFRRMVVGVGMVPRGEVGLIFADIGRRAGILNEALFGAILLMIMATTFVAPPGLKLLFGSRSSQPAKT
jgi:Kef-type K+ transport system membrane component KefB